MATQRTNGAVAPDLRAEVARAQATQATAAAEAGDAAVAAIANDPNAALGERLLAVARYSPYGQGGGFTFSHAGTSYAVAVLALNDAATATVLRGTTPTNGYHSLAAVARKSASAILPVPADPAAERKWPEVQVFQIAASVTCFDQSAQGRDARQRAEADAEIKREHGKLEKTRDAQLRALGDVSGSVRMTLTAEWNTWLARQKSQVTDEVRARYGLTPRHTTAEKGLSRTDPVNRASGPVVDNSVPAPVPATGDPFAAVEVDVLAGVSDEPEAIKRLSAQISAGKLTKAAAMERLNEWRTASKYDAMAFEAEAGA